MVLDHTVQARRRRVRGYPAGRRLGSCRRGRRHHTIRPLRFKCVVYTGRKALPLPRPRARRAALHSNLLPNLRPTRPTAAAAGPGRAYAACSVEPDLEDGVGSGCVRCSADGARCEECGERYGLKKDGTCVTCQPVLVGKLLEEKAPVRWWADTAARCSCCRCYYCCCCHRCCCCRHACALVVRCSLPPGGRPHCLRCWGCGLHQADTKCISAAECSPNERCVPAASQEESCA